MSAQDKRLGVQGPRGLHGEQGPQGNQGNRGEHGTAGLSRPVRRALVFLFILAVLLGGLSLFWTAHAVHASQVSQQRAGAVLGEKLCATFGRLAALKPPAGSAARNPSRAYLQAQHDTLVQLGADLGCK